RTGQPMIRQDDPQHRRLRGMVSRDFTARRMELLRPAVQRVVDSLVDDLVAAGEGCDFVSAFAFPLPSTVICLLLGVPNTDHAFFQQRTLTLVDWRTTPEGVQEANRELTEYMVSLVDAKDAKDAEPGDDLISRLVVEQHRAGEISKRAIADLARMMLVA